MAVKAPSVEVVLRFHNLHNLAAGMLRGTC